MRRSRSGCRVIRAEPCNGGAVGHPSPESVTSDLQCHLRAPSLVYWEERNNTQHARTDPAWQALAAVVG